MKARIYEIKSSAVANAELLRDEENDLFYWNDFKFGGFVPEDHIFIINPHKKWAIYAHIIESEIPTTHDLVAQRTRFEHDGRTYEVEDRTHFFKKFVCFRMVQNVIIPEEWRWTTIIGQSDAYDLYKDGIDKPSKRLEKIGDLMRLFNAGDGRNALEEIRGALESFVQSDPPAPTRDGDSIEGTRETFRQYLLNDVKAAPTTVQQYIGAMDRLQRWFIEQGAAEPGFQIWRDRDAVNAIQAKLDGEASGPWADLNKRQNNSSRAPWNHWRRFIAGSHSNGMRFDHEHRTVITAIRTKPFILLAGISGTGKSRLVRSLAYLTCSDPALQHRKRPGNFELVMVKPNWHDPTELMGYVSRITGAAEYAPKDFLRFVVRAWGYPHVPFFLCLDEMNLAPVEQYFADFLSVVETRRRNAEGQLVTDALLKADASVPAPVFEDLLGKLGLEPGSALWERFMKDGITLPPNLVVMGTVNMDETTHSFSRKVLDRAMTFEMNEVDLRAGLGEEDEGWRYPEMPLAPNWVLGTVTRGGEVPPTTEGYNETLAWLEKMNREVLEGTPFKVAYRVRDEYLAYVFHNAQLAAKPKEWLATCLDELLVMKVLSRIEGDEGKVKDVLDKLLALVPEQWPHSTRKLKEMKARLERSGYTSFWS